jgi:hypothetical protein
MSGKTLPKSKRRVVRLEDFARELNTGVDRGPMLENAQEFLQRAHLKGTEVPPYIEVTNFTADLLSGDLVVVQSSDFIKMVRALHELECREPDPE